jgi:hypothetical protein
LVSGQSLDFDAAASIPKRMLRFVGEPTDSKVPPG